MLGWLGKRHSRVHPLFLQQGLVWEQAEIRALRRFLHALRSPTLYAPLTLLSLPMRDLYGKQHWSTTGKRVPDSATSDEAVYLPGRNLMLLSKAAVFCALHEIPVIALGSLDHNPFPDATPKFFRDFAATAGEALNQRLTVIAPFRSLSKATVIRRSRDLPLHLSFSCLAPVRGQHCGICNKCAERQLAFQTAGVNDATKYNRLP
jgi:7-cyano-7-deazaguanine synthase